MKIASWSGQFDLIVVETSQAVSDGRYALRKHGSVRYQQGIGFEFFFIFLHIVPQADAANFLFAFDENFYVYGKFAVDFLQTLERFQVNMHLALVVGGASAEKFSVADGRFEGRRSPQLQRLGGLHIVVTIKEDRGFTGGFQRFGVYQRMQTSRNDFNRFKASGAQILGHPPRAVLHVLLVLGFRADAGDAQE